MVSNKKHSFLSSKMPWRYVIPRPGYFLGIEEARITRSNALIINAEAFHFGVKVVLALAIFTLILILVPIIFAIGLLLVVMSSLISRARPNGARANSSRNIRR